MTAVIDTSLSLSPSLRLPRVISQGRRWHSHGGWRLGSLFWSETRVPELSGVAECKHSRVIFGGVLKASFSEAPFYPSDTFS